MHKQTHSSNNTQQYNNKHIYSFLILHINIYFAGMQTELCGTCRTTQKTLQAWFGQSCPLTEAANTNSFENILLEGVLLAN
jgi:hypothetical protein